MGNYTISRLGGERGPNKSSYSYCSEFTYFGREYRAELYFIKFKMPLFVDALVFYVPQSSKIAREKHIIDFTIPILEKP